MNTETINSRAGILSPDTSIAHDLRSPLATIHTGAEMLVRFKLSELQVNRIARNIYRASLRMRDLIEDVLDADRCMDLRRQPCSIRDLIANAVDGIAVCAQDQFVSIIQAVPGGLILSLDRGRMRRVLMNLLVNALEAMPNGGTIHIKAASDAHSVWIRVRDSGPGIAPEVRGRLFERFVTAGKKSGVGLGLALSRQSVVDHGGELWAEESDLGACLTIRLPRTNLGRRPPMALSTATLLEQARQDCS